MLCFRCIICVIYVVKIFSLASVPDYIIVKSSTDFSHNFTVNVTGTAAEYVHLFRNQVIIGSCAHNTCTDCRHQGSSCNLTSKYSASSTSIVVQLTIKNIQRTSWDETISVSNGTNLISARCSKQVYRLIIYSEIRHIDCFFGELKEGIRMKCTSPDIFPNAISFSIYNNTARINGYCEETSSNEVGFLKNVTCSFNISKDQLQSGNTPINATMYLNITGDEKKDINFGINHPTILHLENPTVTLGIECKETYILEGQTGQCTCLRTDTSDVAPDIVWYYPNNTIAAGGSRLTFIATRNSTFICNSSFPFGWSVVHKYSPLVAYGPKSVNLSLYPTEEDLHLCEEQLVTVTYKCTVSKDDVYPSFSIVIRQNNTILTNSTDIYNVTSTTTLLKGGVYMFSCQAKNNESREANVFQTLSKNVIEAPNIPEITILKINTNRNDKKFNTTENTTYILQCEVIGGYPVVSNITIECGSYRNVSINSIIATLAVNAITSDLEDMNCSCSASHISTCYYNNKTVVSLRSLLPTPLEMESTLIIAAPITAALCLVLIIILATFLFQRNGSTQQKKYYNLKEPSETKNFDIYFYQSWNNFYPNVYKSYDMIIPTITSAACGPLNSKENIYFNSC